MLRIGDVELRNLQEQVLQNQSDIKYLLEEGAALNEFGIKVVGVIDLPEGLPDPTTYEGEFGDAYAVGTEAPYTLYIFTRQVSGQTGSWWFNIGLFPAPSTVPGEIGPQGIRGETGTRGSLWYSQTGAPTNTVGVNPNDQALDGTNGNVYQFVNGAWQLTGNIRGIQGIQGIPGIQGIQGIQGIPGIQGPKGDPSSPVEILGVLDNINQLPMPDSVPRYAAYLIKQSDGSEHLYLLVGEGTSENPILWHDAGSFGGGSKITIDNVNQNEVELGYIPKISTNYEIGENTQVISNGSEVTFSGLQAIGYNAINEQIEGETTIELPISSGEDIAFSVINNTLQAALTSGFWDKVDEAVGDAKPIEIQINAPTTSTNGQLTAEQLATLQENKGAYLLFNNEIYRLQDTQHIAGYLVYSHLGYENTTQKYIVKCITVTINTRGWVLTTREIINPTELAKYLPLAGGILTGAIDMPVNGGAMLRNAGTSIYIASSASSTMLDANTDSYTFFREYLKWLCASYPNKQNAIFLGDVKPNSQGFAVTYIYDTSAVNEAGLPRYASGFCQHYSLEIDTYVCQNFSYNYSNLLARNGGTMTGIFKLWANQYNQHYAMDCQNSSIIGCNAFVWADAASDGKEGLIFPRGYSQTPPYDSLYVNDGKLYLETNMPGINDDSPRGTVNQVWPLSTFSSGKNGIVPGPTSTQATTSYYLRGDGSWGTINIPDVPSITRKYQHNILLNSGINGTVCFSVITNNPNNYTYMSDLATNMISLYGSGHFFSVNGGDSTKTYNRINFNSNSNVALWDMSSTPTNVATAAIAQDIVISLT